MGGIAQRQKDTANTAPACEIGDLKRLSQRPGDLVGEHEGRLAGMGWRRTLAGEAGHDARGHPGAPGKEEPVTG
jgi:hypothetical protein